MPNINKLKLSYLLSIKDKSKVTEMEKSDGNDGNSQKCEL